jgi:acid phosphatase
MKMRLAILAAVIGFSILPMGPSLRQAPAPATEAAGKFAANAPSEAIPNLDGEKAQLKQYHDCTCKCGCYANDLDLQAGRAIEFLRRRVAHRAGDEKLALVLDIDETTLSNYEEKAGADFAYDSDVFNAWVNSAKAPAIPGTLRVYLEAQRRGVSVFFLTGRPESQRAVTEQNLHNAAFQNWQRLILRPPTQASATAQIFKSAARAQIAAQGYKLILNIGDQWSDLKGDSEAEYSVKYPDPFYFIK